MNQVRVGVGLFIFNDQGQVLLGLRKGSHAAGDWAAPGGHLEMGESWEQCAAREAWEETGLKIDPASISFYAVTNDVFSKEKHYITLSLTTRWHEKIGAPKIMEPDKCAEWKWFDLDQLPKNLMIPTRKFLESYRK